MTNSTIRIAAIGLGNRACKYVLLEKPMGQTLDHCQEIH